MFSVQQSTYIHKPAPTFHPTGKYGGQATDWKTRTHSTVPGNHERGIHTWLPLIRTAVTNTQQLDMQKFLNLSRKSSQVFAGLLFSSILRSCCWSWSASLWRNNKENLDNNTKQNKIYNSAWTELTPAQNFQNELTIKIHQPAIRIIPPAKQPNQHYSQEGPKGQPQFRMIQQ